MRELPGQFGDAGGSLAERAVREFAGRFERDAEAVAVAPGRVNLIGDHTDYNDGFVLPLAIDRFTAVAGAPRTDRTIRVGSTRSGEVVTLAHDETDAGWTRYVRGVVELCRESGLDAGGLDLWIDSSVPTAFEQRGVVCGDRNADRDSGGARVWSDGEGQAVPARRA